MNARMKTRFGTRILMFCLAAAAAGAKDPLTYGFAVDGHPENAAASAMGGLVVAAVVDVAPVARHLRLDPDIRFVVVVPDKQLATSRARGTLPEMVPHEDAAFNLGRLGLLVAGLADHTQLLAAAINVDTRVVESWISSIKISASTARVSQRTALSRLGAPTAPATLAR